MVEDNYKKTYVSVVKVLQNLPEGIRIQYPMPHSTYYASSSYFHASFTWLQW